MEPKATDIRPEAVRLYFLPVRTRVPLKFGRETLTCATCARVSMRVRTRRGSAAEPDARPRTPDTSATRTRNRLTDGP